MIEDEETIVVGEPYEIYWSHDEVAAEIALGIEDGQYKYVAGVVWTGEKRMVCTGEWYLRTCEPGDTYGYRASEPSINNCYIGKIVKCQRKLVVV
jgi:hypothetical protein